MTPTIPTHPGEPSEFQSVSVVSDEDPGYIGLQLRRTGDSFSQYVWLTPEDAQRLADLLAAAAAR